MKSLAGAIGAVTVATLTWAASRAATPPPSPALLAPGRASSLAAAAMSARAAKGALKSGQAAMRSGRLADALRQYESVLASSSPAPDARAEALYWAGMLRLSQDPALRSVDRARAYLGELKVFHGANGRQDEAALVLALTEELNDAGRTGESLRAELASSRGAGEACRTEKGEADGRLQAALSENDALKQTDSAQRSEIQGLRDELKRKDEALRKVKEVVVGWKAPR